LHQIMMDQKLLLQKLCSSINFLYNDLQIKGNSFTFNKIFGI